MQVLLKSSKVIYNGYKFKGQLDIWTLKRKMCVTNNSCICLDTWG